MRIATMPIRAAVPRDTSCVRRRGGLPTSIRRWLCGAVAVLCTATGSRAAWLDGETRGCPSNWSERVGQVRMGISQASQEPPVEGVDPPSGAILNMMSHPEGLAQTVDGLLPEDLTDQSDLVFWFRFDVFHTQLPLQTQPEIEFQFIEADGVSKFWRRVPIRTRNWMRIELPLRFFQTSGVRMPQWSKVRHFAIRFLNSGLLLIDNVSFVRDPERNTEVSLDEVREIAFPDASASAVRSIRSPEYVVMTDSTNVDLKGLAATLDPLTAELRSLCPDVPPPRQSPVLLLFATDAARRLHLNRLDGRTGAQGAPSNRSGRTPAGLVPFTWDSPNPLPASVPFHSFVQAWLSQAGALACEEGWLNRAIAKHYLHAHARQKELAARMRNRIDFDFYDPFGALCVDQPPEADADWQLASLFGMLRSREPYASRLPAFLSAVRQQNLLNLGWHIGPVFGVDLQRLTGDWEDYCAKTYGSVIPPPLEDSDLARAASRFALTPTSAPAYNENLAAYCRLILARIKGLQKDPFSKIADRHAFGRADWARGASLALVGRGMWRECEAMEIHVLDDPPFWFVPNYDVPEILHCGRGVSLQSRGNDWTMQVTLVGVTIEELEAAAAGRGMPKRHQEDPEFPPLTGQLRESDLPFQYDTWLPSDTFVQGELIPVYSILRNRMGAPQRVEKWNNVYENLGDRDIEGRQGPDGQGAMAFGLYRIDRGKAQRVPPDPKLEKNLDLVWFPRPVLPPHGAFIQVMLLNPAYDVSRPGDYEIWATYPSDDRKPRSRSDTFTGLIPAPPVRFRVVPPPQVMWGWRALIALPIAVLLAAGAVLVRRRSIRARQSPAAPPPHS